MMADMTYLIATGEFYLGAELLEKGYSGYYNKVSALDYRNTPFARHLKNQGPPPVGRYYMSDGKGAVTKDSIRLRPVHIMATVTAVGMYNRDSFYIHGDNMENSGTGSQGCIILGAASRKKILKALRSDGTTDVEIRHGLWGV